MRTSLNNIKTIDDYISGSMHPGDAMVFQANMLLNSDLKNEVMDMQIAHTIIRHYSRQSIKSEITAVHNAILNAPHLHLLMKRVANLFK